MIIKTIALAALVLLAACGKKTEDIGNKTGDGIYSRAQDPASATEALFNAIDANENILAKEAVKQGAEINALFPNGETPLTMALKKTKLSLVYTILQAKADVNMPNLKNEYPIHLAIQSRDRDSLHLLLTKDIDIDINIKNRQKQSPLVMAIAHEDELTALKLVKMGAKLKCKDQYGFSALELSERMSFHVLAQLIKDAASLKDKALSASNIPALIKKSNVHFLEYLLRQRSLKERSDGLNPLSLALGIEDAYVRNKTLKLFLRHGFNPDGEPNDTKIPLSEAVKRRDFFALNTLLLNRADPNLKDEENRTPLIHAVEKLSFSMVKKLVYYQARLTYEYEREDFVYVMDACRNLPDAGFFMFRRISREERQKRDAIKEFLGCF